MLRRRSEADETKFFRWVLTGRRMAEKQVWELMGGRMQWRWRVLPGEVQAERAIAAEKRWGQ